MECSSSAALVYSVCYCPLAFLVPLVQNCLPGFPLEHCVLHLFNVVVPPDHDSVSWDVPLRPWGFGPVSPMRWIVVACLLERCWWWPSSEWVPCNSCVREATSLAKQSRSSQTMPTDDAVNLTSESHDPDARMNHWRKRKQEKDLTESTGVVPANYPPKVKLELFSQL